MNCNKRRLLFCNEKQANYVKRNIEARSWNHCCGWKKWVLHILSVYL